jgi:hypothetical protein
MFCENCGNQMKDGAKFCPKCGGKVQAEPAHDVQTPKIPQPVRPDTTPTIPVAPSQTQVSDHAKASPKLKPIFALFIVIAVMGGGLILVISFGIRGCGKIFHGDVSKVKNGTLEFDETVKVGDAFDNYKYFSKTSWKEITSDQNKKVVEFVGTYDDSEFNKICEEEFKNKEAGIKASVDEEMKSRAEAVNARKKRLEVCQDAYNNKDKLNACHCTQEEWNNERDRENQLCRPGGWVDTGAAELIGRNVTNCRSLFDNIAECIEGERIEDSNNNSEQVVALLQSKIDSLNTYITKAEKIPAPHNVNDTRNHCVKKVEFTVQFILHPNDESFELGYQGSRITCNNGKTEEKNLSAMETFGFYSIIEMIYKGEKLPILNCE